MIDEDLSVVQIRDQYFGAVGTIASKLLLARDCEEYRTVDEAMDHMHDLVIHSPWLEDERVSALVLYYAKVPDSADYFVDPEDYDWQNPHRQRAEYAMERDVVEILWMAGWSAAGPQYRGISETSEVIEDTKRRTTIPRDIADELLEYGFVVCDQLGADRNIERNPEYAEVKLLRALERLRKTRE